MIKSSESATEYRLCMSCVMDTSDPQISFDADGVCDHCRAFVNDVGVNWSLNGFGMERLQAIADGISREGRGKEFDCLLGLSGGVDSSYMLDLAVRRLGLRPLVFHVDGGWNTELAVHNIERLVEQLGLDLYTQVIDWEEMRDLQLAFFQSGVPHLDIPQDHAFVATLYHYAEKHGIKYILNGGNLATECVRNPLTYYYYGTDLWQISDIHGKYGTRELRTYPFSSVFRHKIYLRYVRGVRVIKPLDFVPYRKNEALKYLEAEYAWKPYPQKHFESRFTRFLEGYWLPNRFGFDPRRVQLSSLVLTGQMTRDAALEVLAQPPLDAETVRRERLYISKKLGISEADLDSFMTMPKKYYWDYRNQKAVFDLGARVLRALGIEKSIKR